MFTGIVTDIGEVAESRGEGDIRRLSILCSYPASGIALGASIACSGVCLTATSVRDEGGRTRFDVDLGAETRALTTAEGWRPGTRINLERSLKLGNELGGHIVSGHVDGLSRIVERDDLGHSTRFGVEAPGHLARFIAPKGSVALDGTSLTVNHVAGTRFDVLLIPHTLAATTWGERQVGDGVNLEIDMLARYVARLSESMAGIAQAIDRAGWAGSSS